MPHRLEHQDCIHDMLHDFWTRHVAIFGDMPDQHHRRTCFFGVSSQTCCGFTHLRYPTSRTAIIGLHRLNRIHNHQFGAFHLEQCCDAVGVNITGHENIAFYAQTICPKAHLLERLFTSHVQDFFVL